MRTSEISVRQACEDLVAARVPRVLAGVEAQALRQLLRVQGLSGVAARAIAEGDLTLPGRVADSVTRDWAAARAWCDQVDRQCARVAAVALRAHGEEGLAPPVLLKGSAVARRYRDPAVRPYVDVDLLVPPDEVQRWSQLLRGLGYWAPEPEVEAVRRRYQESVNFLSADPSGKAGCDLHACLFIERRARALTYTHVAARSQASAFPGLLEPARDMQLIVLALHLAHHTKDTWRLIWLRDFLELATSEAVDSARRVAADHGVAWALELALGATEEVLGTPTWAARSPRDLSLLARVHQLDGSGYLRHVVLAYDLGPRAGAWYLWSRLTPRRFMKPDGFDRQAFHAWVRRVLRRARRTSWLGAMRRPS